MKNTKVKKIIAIVLAMISIMSFMSVLASAATTSSGKSTRTITVTTKANWLIPGSESVTLSQSKGVCTGTKYNLKFQAKTVKTNQYGIWDVVAKATDGSHTVKKTFSGSSLKISLKPNKTYKITVSWSSQNTFTELEHGPFTTIPTWKVSSTYKVSNIY